MTVIVCGGAVYYQRDKLPCYGLCYEFERKCGRTEAPSRLCIVSYDWSPYYSPNVQCTVCGDRWEDEYLHERPFRRGWRAEAIAAAAEKLRTARLAPPKRDREGYIILPTAAAS